MASSNDEVEMSSLEWIAGGMYGKVYRGQVNAGGRSFNVAVKVYNEHNSQEFEAELKLSKINHPNIISFFGADIEKRVIIIEVNS